MEIKGFYVTKKGKVVNVDIDVDKVLVKAGITAIIFAHGINGGTIYAKTISEGLQPLVDVLKDLAEPISYGFMVKGFLKIMAGEEHEGLKTIKGAIGGFIGIQWIPQIFKIIKGIGL